MKSLFYKYFISKRSSVDRKSGGNIFETQTQLMDNLLRILFLTHETHSI